MGIFSKRLKEVRLASDLSQERLGVLAGIDEMSASARMNQYEKGKHEPDFSMVERLAVVLNAPEGYFYTKDDDMADLLITLHRLNKKEKLRLIGIVKDALSMKE